MNVSRSGNFFSAPSVAGVRFGARNHTARSTSRPGRTSGSISLPPENSGPDFASEIGSDVAWQGTQVPTDFAGYSPRAAVGPRGDTFGAWTSDRGPNAGANVLTTAPTSVHSASGTGLRTAGRDRRYETMAMRSSSLMFPNGISSWTDACPSG